MHRIQHRDIKYNKQLKSLLRKLMFTKCEVSPLCQNITYISRKGMGDRVSRPVSIENLLAKKLEFGHITILCEIMTNMKYQP